MDKDDLIMESPKDYITVEEIKQTYCGNVNDRDFDLIIRSDYFPSVPTSKTKYVIPKKAFQKFIEDPDKIIWFKQQMKKSTFSNFEE